MSPNPPKPLEVIAAHAAGIDVGAAEHWVCVPTGDDRCVRCFGCYTRDLEAIADWLESYRVSTVAMESTGVYWLPLFEVLESRGFEVCLVNARHLKSVPGRKSDMLDCQWLQQLHSYGLLQGSFHPAPAMRVLRSYIRHREKLVRSGIVHIQRMQKALEQMNVQLHRVISDITGKTGLSILQAMIAGERDPVKLAQLRDPRIKSSPEEIAAALTGTYREDLLFVLRQEMGLYQTYQRHIQQCDQQIEAYLKQLEAQRDSPPRPPLPPSTSKRKKPKGNAPAFDLRSYLYQLSGVDFTQVDGLDALSVVNILSEVGLDPSRFPSSKHFTSWLGLSPGSRISGGKVLSSRTRKVVNRAATAFRIAAQTLYRSDSALGAFYRRLKSRLGPAKAITATAHKLARIFYRLWRDGTAYEDPGADVYEKRYRQRLVKNLQRKAHSLGLMLVTDTRADLVPESVS
ncbi:MAG: IS110 family transposase [Leptolyngbya sp. SIO1E4]|nr:IS110 family transposase [Leptolyngbya sp. SIO1E4]MBE7384870.1 IS110 family transposase [Leptolyngbya sp. SIO1E4]MBE7385101.1 IS110 family transposase [Leptolyngbya sp. SIO1E4]